MADGVKPTELDLKIARDSLKTQFEYHCPSLSENVDGFHPESVKPFLDHVAQMLASERAYCRMLQNVMHRQMDESMQAMHNVKYKEIVERIYGRM